MVSIAQPRRRRAANQFVPAHPFKPSRHRQRCYSIAAPESHCHHAANFDGFVTADFPICDDSMNFLLLSENSALSN
jgi:hypothetical protein